MTLLESLRRFDWALLACAVGLTVLGIAFIHSATFGRAEGNIPSGSRHVLSARAWGQTQWALIALVAFVAVAAVDYTVWMRWSYLFYGAGIVALVLLIGYGVTLGGSRRWFRIGPRLVQPSEFMKVAFVLSLARYLMFGKNRQILQGLLVPFLLALVPMLFVLKQPDLGTSLLFLPVLFAMLYVAGARPRHLWTMIGLGASCAPLLWCFYMTAPQKARITAFISPEADPRGAGYQLIESLIAIGTGGLAGKGYMQGSQNLLKKVPALHTDFILTAICEEWGFLGGALVVALYLVMFYRMFSIAARTREPFGRLVVVGGASLLAFQTVVNIGMTMRLCPITGLTLPFVSYGGSSLLTCFILLGLIAGIGVRPKVVMVPDDDLA